MSRPILLTVFAGAAIFFLLMPRLPAPIVEESSPSTSEQSPKPKAKRVTEPKTNRNANTSTVASTSNPTPSKRFAGKWSGIMPEVPWGNIATELVVDQAETTMEWQESGKRKGVAKTQLSGNTLLARFPIGFTTAVWFISPQPGGATATIRLTAFMNDDTAVFRRTSP